MDVFDGVVEVHLPNRTLELRRLPIINREDYTISFTGHSAHFVVEHFRVKQNSSAAVRPNVRSIVF